jgi:hypothetical protein
MRLPFSFIGAPRTSLQEIQQDMPLDTSGERAPGWSPVSAGALRHVGS